MNKDNLIDKIKRNILKLIFCHQRTFKVNNMVFRNGRPVKVKNAMVAENENFILKLQIYRHRLKRNDIIEEGNVLKLLSQAGGASQPVLYSTGRDFFKRPYLIMEKVENKDGIQLADVLFAILEQHKLGVFHRDTVSANVLFNGLIAKIIDYDQSQIVEEIKELNPKDSIMFFINELAHCWVEKDKLLNIGQGIDEVTKNCMSYFVGDAFDFSTTGLYKSFEPMPFYAINEQQIQSSGEIDINNWKNVLNQIEFKENEKVLDVNPDTGELSRYLSKRGCDTVAYSTHDNENYATKIISNILGVKINAVKELNEEMTQFSSVFLLNNRENVDLNKFIGADRLILRQKNDEDLSQNILDKYTITKSFRLDENSNLIIADNYMSK